MKALPDDRQSFAQTQGLWRFLANARVTPGVLAAPMLALVQEEVAVACEDVLLATHDWCRINYHGHHGKRDRLRMTHDSDVGFELQSSVMVGDRAGDPLGAAVQNLATGQGVWSTYRTELQPHIPHLDELSLRMQWLEQQDWGKPLVHLVDREADSVDHLRQWSTAGHQWLIRAKAGSRIGQGAAAVTLAQAAAGLSYRPAAAFEHEGRSLVPWVGSGTVVLTRPARPKRKDAAGQRVPPVAGEPLTVRLVVSRVRDGADAEVATWYLLTRVAETIPDATIAQWYAWRWRIESYFKLLKQAGQQLESWEQETGLAILKRLLIAGQACAQAWRLLRATDPADVRTREFLIRLSGRQMKRQRPATASALLDGLFKLFAMMELLEHHPPDTLREFAQTAFPRHTGPWRKHRDV